MAIGSGQTVNDIIDSRPVSRFQSMTILLCGLVLLLDGFDTQAMGFLVPPIAEELGIPLAAFGPVLSAGLFGLMLGAMGSGPIADRWGRKLPLILSIVWFSLFTVLSGFSTSYAMLFACRALFGIGKMLFGNYGAGLLFFAAAGAAVFVIYQNLKKISFT